MTALRMGEGIGATASRMRVIFMLSSQLSSRHDARRAENPEPPSVRDPSKPWAPDISLTRNSGMTLRTSIELGERELAVAERFGGREAAVGGTDDHVDQRVAGRVERLVAAQDASNVDVDVLGHGAQGLRIA